MCENFARLRRKPPFIISHQLHQPLTAVSSKCWLNSECNSTCDLGSSTLQLLFKTYVFFVKKYIIEDRIFWKTVIWSAGSIQMQEPGRMTQIVDRPWTAPTECGPRNNNSTGVFFRSVASEKMSNRSRIDSVAPENRTFKVVARRCYYFFSRSTL